MVLEIVFGIVFRPLINRLELEFELGGGAPPGPGGGGGFGTPGDGGGEAFAVDLGDEFAAGGLADAQRNFTVGFSIGAEDVHEIAAEAVTGFEWDIHGRTDPAQCVGERRRGDGCSGIFRAGEIPG